MRQNQEQPFLYVDGSFPIRNAASADMIRGMNPAVVIAGSGLNKAALDWFTTEAGVTEIYLNIRPWSTKPWRTLGHTPERRIWDLKTHISYVIDRYFPDWLDRTKPAFSGIRDLANGKRPKEFLAPMNDPAYVDWLIRSVRELSEECDVHLWHEWGPITQYTDWYPIREEDLTTAWANGVVRYLQGLEILHGSNIKVGTNVLTRSTIPEDAIAAANWCDIVKIEWPGLTAPHDYRDPEVDEAVRGPRWFARNGKTVCLEIWRYPNQNQHSFMEHWNAALSIQAEIRTNLNMPCLVVAYPVAEGTTWPNHRTWPTY